MYVLQLAVTCTRTKFCSRLWIVHPRNHGFVRTKEKLDFGEEHRGTSTHPHLASVSSCFILVARVCFWEQHACCHFPRTLSISPRGLVYERFHYPRCFSGCPFSAPQSNEPRAAERREWLFLDKHISVQICWLVESHLLPRPVALVPSPPARRIEADCSPPLLDPLPHQRRCRSIHKC